MATKSLFPKQARSQFYSVTLQAYGNMKRRAEKKGIRLPFVLVNFRAHILVNFMGGEYDGAINCPHCLRKLDITEVAFDHKTPLSRGGSWGLDNIAVPCQACNLRKGELMAEEFNDLLSFLEREIPFARTSILKRLQEHSKLLAGRRRAEMQLRGHNPRRSTKPPLVHVMEEAF